jgi:hypothetical protein
MLLRKKHWSVCMNNDKWLTETAILVPLIHEITAINEISGRVSGYAQSRQTITPIAKYKRAQAVFLSHRNIEALTAIASPTSRGAGMIGRVGAMLFAPDLPR